MYLQATDENKSGFDGHFTPTVIDRLKEKIKELGIPRHIISRYLGINTSTLYKWETGNVTKCNLSLHGIVDEFLNGIHDKNLKNAYYIQSSEKYMNSDELTLTKLLRTLHNDYSLCAYYKCGDKFTSHMEQAFQQTLSQIVPDLIEAGCHFDTLRKILDLRIPHSMQSTDMTAIKRKRAKN